jgi:hypothetical protein
MTPKNIFCLGMIRSGSTWQFNVAREIVEAAWPEEERPLVHKAHNIIGSVRDVLDDPENLIMYIHRDIRDALASYWEHYGTGDEQSLKHRASLAIVHHREVMRLTETDAERLFYMEYTEMVESPLFWVEATAEFLCVPYPDTTSGLFLEVLPHLPQIADRWSIPEVQKRMAERGAHPNEVLGLVEPNRRDFFAQSADPVTKVTGHHISRLEGEIGRYKRVKEGTMARVIIDWAWEEINA